MVSGRFGQGQGDSTPRLLCFHHALCKLLVPDPCSVKVRALTTVEEGIVYGVCELLHVASTVCSPSVDGEGDGKSDRHEHSASNEGRAWSTAAQIGTPYAFVAMYGHVIPSRQPQQ